MNAISIFFKLAGRQADIRKAWTLYTEIKEPLTELIDLCRSLLADVGALEPRGEVSPLAAYGTTWVQESLNTLQDAGLEVDGELGPSTVEAIKTFQKAHPPLKVDGAAGVQTAAAIATAMESHKTSKKG